MDIASRIYNTAIADGLPALLSTFLVGQAAHETDGFTSPIFTDCNNCFGYKEIGQSLSNGPCIYHSAYASYSSIEDSVHEMTAYIKRRQNDGSFPSNLNDITTPGQYATLLKNTVIGAYFEDPVSVYTNGIVNWLKQLNISTTAKIGGDLLIVGLVLWIFRKPLFHSKQ